ncbi:hypothetical protein DFA_09529 [Cavenderia fasciculata]|uniref:Uncharacterized protein n=1 Tax=Cavenderia fasciculata TaxID=261658 RepID=F4Q7W0_CACFS|nr:uncharacterized protein DFA_09529 [Cavenderia fasciculata]EGG15860.1 hypothetical protein DFA_09529 [Cavenderia fasciculata]|eukprot:XP_004352185.1 hypothetical protein DFA_09529 [Cavenderia fasciculata]
MNNDSLTPQNKQEEKEEKEKEREEIVSTNPGSSCSTTSSSYTTFGNVPKCYQNGYHPSGWDMVQVFLAGIWKPFKIKSILEHKNRIKLDLKVGDVCKDARLLTYHQDDIATVDDQAYDTTLYQLLDNQPTKPILLFCGSYT